MNDKDMEYIKNGLCQEEVERLRAEGLHNACDRVVSKTVSQILRENVFTLFNLWNVMIAIALALVHAWTNTLFIVIVGMNVMIAVLQELYAKRLVDKLSLMAAPSACVMRDGVMVRIPIEEVVLHDILILDSEQQICCDALVVSGEMEVNEALLSGESDPVHKSSGDTLLSGSSVISGKSHARVVHVGKDNYAYKATREAKKLRRAPSVLMKSMEKVTRITSMMIVPLGVVLFLEAYSLRDSGISEAVVVSAAGLLGMLPKGLVLLISVSLAVGVRKLAKKQILIQDLYSLETLAHVDTLCLDKTGTMTSGRMKVEEVIGPTRQDQDVYIPSFLRYSDDNNATHEALCAYFGVTGSVKPSHKIAFSSQRKWSAAVFQGVGTLVMGAPDRLMAEVPRAIMEKMASGYRVIVIGFTCELVYDTQLPELEILYTIVLREELRVKVEETLAYFKGEGVAIKVISGDHPLAVSAIARKAGFTNSEAYVDMSEVEEDDGVYDRLVRSYAVFGRVSPRQKQLLVRALRRQGHVVAMSGDGVNDIPALQEADCSIAIAQGSDAVRQVASVVLLNSEFSALPDVVMEGRRVVNNVTRVASVFFIKTFYSILLALLCALGNVPFPFLPIQITLMDAMIEAMPAFLTMLERNTNKVEGRFLPSACHKALPNALAIVVLVLVMWGMEAYFGMNEEMVSTMVYGGVAVISMQAVIRSCLPMNRLRFVTCASMVIGFSLALFLFHDWLSLVMPTAGVMMVGVLCVLAALVLERILSLLFMMVFAGKSGRCKEGEVALKDNA